MTKNTARLLRGGATKETFPMRLHAILADPTVCDVISWLPHGKSFVILRPDVFVAQVLPRYFAPDVRIKNPRCVHKYPSFVRKLHRCRFCQSFQSFWSSAFSHELFQRDYPELCRGMKCQSKPKTPMFGQGDTITTITDVIMVAEEAGTTEAQPKTDAIKGATTTTKKKKYDESDDDEDFDDDFEEPPPKKRAATAKKSKTGRTDDSDSISSLWEPSRRPSPTPSIWFTFLLLS
jgi:hypothetical protein